MRRVRKNPKWRKRDGQRQYYDPEEEGIRIENLPEPNVGEQTGWWFTDYHGTWYEVERDSDGSMFWMIGEPRRSNPSVSRQVGPAGATRNPRRKLEGGGTASFSSTEKGIRIENLPDPDVGTQTGWFFNDYHGTWYEVERDVDKSKFWMIGEAKEQRISPAGATRRRNPLTDADIRKEIKYLEGKLDTAESAGREGHIDDATEWLAEILGSIQAMKRRPGAISKKTVRDVFEFEKQVLAVADEIQPELESRSRAFIRHHPRRRNPELMLMMNPGDSLTAETQRGRRGTRRNPFKVIARHKWVPGATITESVNEEKSTAKKSYRRFTATIRGWQSWRVFEGHVDPDTVRKVIEKVKSIKQRIDTGDESVFERGGVARANPRRRKGRKTTGASPPKEWLYYAAERIAKRGAPYDPVAVAANIWWHEMKPVTKNKILRHVMKSRIKKRPGSKATVVTSTGPKTKAQVTKVVGKRAAARIYKQMKLYPADIQEAEIALGKAKRPARRRAANPGTARLPASIRNDPAFKRALKQYRKFHGTEPVEIIAVEVDYKTPKFQVVLGEAPDASYKVPGHSKKAGKRNVPYKHDYKGKVLVTTDDKGRQISHVFLDRKTKVTDWIRG